MSDRQGIYMNARQLKFIKPGKVKIDNIILKEPCSGEVVIKTIYCGISPGTERLAFRGELPGKMLLDESIKELGIVSEYPFPYGYILIGEVVDTGSNDNKWMVGKRVLVFHPHQDLIVVSADRLVFLPDEIPSHLAVLIPNCETAVSVLQDAAPIFGEKVCLYGLGVVGQIAARMLSSFPLGELTLIDPSNYRRKIASNFDTGNISSVLQKVPDSNYDISLELSGSPAALQSAIDHSVYSGRILVGSWYGNKNVSLELGSSFHRKRLQLLSSQVSTIAPPLRGRWDHDRRMSTAINWLSKNQNQSWITHEIPFAKAQEAYEIINKPGGEYLQVILEMN
jgi:2-desacetyl-2-hydroxyethyl bacteriochlorophyllide A dehydrogenase